MMDRKPEVLNLLVKPVGSACNLNCAYCYYLEKEKLYPESVGRFMSDELLEKFIREFFAAQASCHVRFDWHGGEPTLLGADTFRKILRWQKQYAKGRQFSNSLQTNGTLLTHEWCNFFRENSFLIGISIDGPRHVHDRYRVDKSGAATFDRVMQGVELLKTHEVEFNTLSVVNDYGSAYPLETYRFLKSIGSRYMQFSPVVERLDSAALPHELALVAPGTAEGAATASWSVGPEAYGRFLCAIFDEWVRNDVGSYFVITFDAVLAKWCGTDPANCAFADICGGGPAMEANGDVYICDHFVYPEHLLGNLGDAGLREMLTSERQLRFGRNKQDLLPGYCRACEYVPICAGECPKHRIAVTPDGEAGLNYLCPGLKLFYAHAAPYMEFMKKQYETNGSPSSVMEWARRSAEFVRKIGVPAPNDFSARRIYDPCPCGSGRKYKFCCLEKQRIIRRPGKR